MTRILSQMMKLPLRALVYSMEMFVKTMQGLQKIADQGINTMMIGPALTDDKTMGAANNLTDDTSVRTVVLLPGDPRGSEGDLANNQRAFTTCSAIVDSAGPKEKETGKMDRDLRDDMLKLVRYKVLFVRREYEVAFPEREDLVSDNMDGAAFTAWKTAEFIQELGKGETRIPKKWSVKKYPPEDRDAADAANTKYCKDGYLMGLPDEDKKYLRVYYEVLERYPREKFKYEEQQIRVLEEIRDKLPSE
jgi:hypothetical protein